MLKKLWSFRNFKGFREISGPRVEVIRQTDVGQKRLGSLVAAAVQNQQITSI